MRSPVRTVTSLILVLLLLTTASAPAHSAAPPQIANPGLWKSLKSSQQAALARNGFAVGPFPYAGHGDPQFYSLYTSNLNAGIPSFITSDAILHTFHIMYDKTLQALERELLAPRLARLSAGLVAASRRQYAMARGAGLREAALLNLGYAAVAESLLVPGTRVPAMVAGPVRRELALIGAHQGFAVSPLFGSQADYSQFVPRGHYNVSPTLQRYFRAMIWYGRMAFLLNGPDATLRTREALLLVLAVSRDRTLNQLWSAIFDPATEWVGHSDDLTIRDYAGVATRVYGKSFTPDTLADTVKLGRFITLARGLPNPQINSGLVGSSQQAAQATKGMRFFPQRFVPDAAVMQALIWDKVGTAQNRRLWPMGMDVAAGLGSQPAISLLHGSLHQYRYLHYGDQLNRLRSYFSSLKTGAWRQNLYWRWLDTLRAVWGPAPLGTPAFMKTPAWAYKSLGTGLGSWAELRHDTLLYAKQPYGLGAGGPGPQFRTPYVEPVPLVWDRLLELVRGFKATLTREGLLGGLTAGTSTGLDLQTAQRVLYPPPPRGESGYRAGVDSFINLVGLLQRTARAEIKGNPLSHTDSLTLENIGTEMEVIDNFFQDNGAGKVMLPQQKIVPVIADVFTEPGSGQVLEEGVGDVLPMYAIVTINGRRWLARGGVFSYYEFHQPMSRRLTDEMWRAMLHRPAQPGWTSIYITR